MKKGDASKVVAMAVCLAMTMPNAALSVAAEEPVQIATDADEVQDSVTDTVYVSEETYAEEEAAETIATATEAEPDTVSDGLVSVEDEMDSVAATDITYEYVEDGKEYGYVYQYSDDETEVIIKRLIPGSSVTGTWEIPATIDGKPVTTIDDYAFAKDTNAQYDAEIVKANVIFPDTMKNINQHAFDSCTGIEGDIVFPDSVIAISDYAFYKCTKLTGDIVIPASVSKIGAYAFNNCTGFDGSLVISNVLNGVELGADSSIDIGRFAFANCSGMKGNLTLLRVGDISESAFSGCSKMIGDLTIPEGTKVIGKQAFYNCSALDGKLTIPSTIVTIDDAAFKGCKGLTCSLGADGKPALVIPEDVTSIGKEAFSGCAKLNGTITLPDGLLTIGDSAFYNCVSLVGDLTLPDSLTSLGKQAFQGCQSLDGVLTLPNGIKEISYQAFYDCQNLKSNTVKDENGNTIQKLIIPESVTFINSGAFCNCKSLTGPLEIPETVINVNGKGLGNGVFAGCSGFDGELTLPSGLTFIDYQTFLGCSGLIGELNIPDGVTSIGKEAFAGCINLGITREGLAEKLNTTTDELDTVMAADDFEMPEYVDLHLPEELQTIGEGAFAECINFTGVLELPEKTKSIGKNAFNLCMGLRGDIVIPDNVTTIGEAAFSNCSGFTGNLLLGKSVSSVGKSAFAGCSKLGSDEGTGDIVIPNTLKKIPEKMFAYCEKIKSVKITRDIGTNNSTKLADIADDAFAQCDTYMKFRVFKNSTAYDWVKTKYPEYYEDIIEELVDVEKITIYCDGNIVETLSDIPGKTYQLSATYEPENCENGDIVWESSAASIASVDAAGLLKLNKTGTATISAKSKAGGDAIAKLEIKVLTAVSGIKITAPANTIMMGQDEYIQLTATVMPEGADNNQVEWSSSDETIATVDQTGKVTPVTAGKVTITAKALDGSGKYGTYTVTVKNTELTKSNTTVTLSYAKSVYAGKERKPGVTVKYNDTVLVEGVDYTVSYSDNVNIGTATVTVTGIGNYSKEVKAQFDIVPGTPKITTALNTNKSVSLKWTKQKLAEGYYVYRKEGTGEYKKIATVKGTSYLDASRVNGVKYTYMVSAYSKGKEGNQSAAKVCVFVAQPQISSIQNVAGRKMAVKWSKVSSASGYQIQYSTSSSMSGAKSITVTSGKTSAKTITSLSKNKKYYVRIRAYKTVSGVKYYSAWSGKKYVTIRK